MTEPITLALLGGAALTEGIKFLYGQATELLKRRRDRMDAAKDGRQLPPAEVQPDAGGDFLDAQLQPAIIDEEAVDRHSKELLALTGVLRTYADDLEHVDENDSNLLAQVDELRALLEMAYQQRITFVGEKGRDHTGAHVDAKIIAREVEGKVTVVEIDQVRSGSVNANADIDIIKKDADVTVFRGKTLG